MNATQVHAFSSTVCAQPLREADVSFLALNPRSRNIDVDIVGERKYSKIAETHRIFLNLQTLKHLIVTKNSVNFEFEGF